MKTRLRELDLIRAWSTFSVIAIHVTAGMVLISSFALTWNQLMRYAVPLFVLLSGLVLAYADAGRPPLPYRVFLQKRFGKILLPYIIWTVIYVLFIARSLLLHDPASWRKIVSPLIDHLVYGTAYYHLYFIIIIFQLYLIYPLLRFWTLKKPSWMVGISLIITGLSLYLLEHGVLVYPRTGFPYVTYFPHWLFYFVLGIYVAQHPARWAQFLSTRLLWVWLAWFATFGYLFLDARAHQSYGSSAKLSVLFYTVTTFALLFGIARNVLRRKVQSISSVRWIHWHEWIASQSFFIFLAHPLVMSLLAIVAPRVGLPAIFEGNPGMVALFVLTSGVTLLAAAIASRLGVASWFGGVSKAG